MERLKPTQELSDIIRAGLLTQCGTEIVDIIVHDITNNADGTCDLALEVYKEIPTCVEGSSVSKSIVFKNLRLKNEEVIDDQTSKEVSKIVPYKEKEESPQIITS